MRTVLATLALGFGLVWAAPAPAQIGSAQTGTTFWTGVNPRNITFVPVDTTKFYKDHNVTQYVHPPSQQRAFSLGNIFPKISMPSWPPKIGQNQNPAQNAFQATAIVPRPK